MMTIKNFLKYNYIVVFIRILISKLIEVMTETKYLSTAGMRKNAQKLQTELIIRAHALEKGMSIGNVRLGFGQAKAISLIKDLQNYIELGGELVFVNECSSIIQSYINFNEKGGADMSEVKHYFILFCQTNHLNLYNYGGIYNLQHEIIKEKEKASFEEFSQSRFSIRDFGSTPIDRHNIENALKLCERTPSACNRQSWRVHIYLRKEDKNKILSLQLGCKGFIEDMQGAILICGDLRCYNFQELNQVYVDGGLYAMNLLYALHYYDIATIPLTMAHKANYIQKILKIMGIANNEVPVILIGIGSYKNEYRVAQSHRKNWKVYTQYEI